MHLSLRAKLIGAFLLVGLLPLLAASGLALWKSSGALEDAAFGQIEAVRAIKQGQIDSYFEERKGDLGVLIETVGTLRRESVNKLTALGQTRKQEVERYFENIENQIITFSEDQMIIDAVKGFRAAFDAYRAEKELAEADLARMKDELAGYYESEFGAEYEAQNDGDDPNASALLAQLDADSIALQYAFIEANPNPLGSKEEMDRPAGDATEYGRLHSRIHPIVRDYLRKFGYYDIFLCDPETGDIVYSVFKELDYSTSLIDGPYADTNFGEAFRQANAFSRPDEFVLVDYEQYTPSYEAAASFIASPIFDGDEKVGVLLFQMPIDRLNTVMSERAGMGETGETYLVGPDYLMRSDSFLAPDTHSVTASFRNPAQGSVKTEAVELALAGKTGADVIQDYNGNPVLSAYCPVQVGDVTWALLAEIDVAEAFCPKDEQGEYYFAKYAEQYGYYDLFLINPDGYCFYTVAQEADYQTNFVDGRFADSGLGRAVRSCIDTKDFAFADFEAYEPSGGVPAAFIAQPYVDSQHSAIDIIVALQLPDDQINAVMKERTGMGETGDSYLVGRDANGQISFRSDLSHRNSEYVIGAPISTAYIEKAMESGDSQGSDTFTDSFGNDVLVSYSALDILGKHWAIIAKIDGVEAFAAVTAVQWMLGILAVVGVVVIVLAAYGIAQSITKPIVGVIEQLSSGASEVNAAAEQVSQSSQSMAEGASEQASSLEETSASLEEMASMTRQNSDNANQANAMVTETREAAQGGSKSVERMRGAIGKIQDSSNETARVIKVIDEIAFQTNLLALNAAVEAARAGEAGKGFAVVAEEVRNLAQRSAEAARETSELIEGSVQNAKNGVEVTEEVAQALEGIASRVEQVTQLINDVSTASAEQTQGIDQVNTAVAEMDKVTQSNAANSEEAASASEELAAQAEALQGMVAALSQTIYGNSTSGRGKSGDSETRRPAGQMALTHQPESDAD